MKIRKAKSLTKKKKKKERPEFVHWSEHPEATEAFFLREWIPPSKRKKKKKEKVRRNRIETMPIKDLKLKPGKKEPKWVS